MAVPSGRFSRRLHGAGKEPVVRPTDFDDPESQRVLGAIADALVGLLAIQQAREDHVKWLSASKE
jgi:hypothetical protein